MKKHLFLFSALILSINLYSQITFEKGYYVNNSDKKIDCLIKNKDSRANPTTFNYKLSEENEEKILTIESVKEFGIYNKSKYIRFDGKIDRASEIVSRMSNIKNPEFHKERLFLKVLLEGKANLYLYEEANLIKFFYSNENSRISQLIFKSYTPANNVISRNNRFKQQLLNDLKCSNITVNEIENLKYRKNNLINFFKRYNKCNNSDNTTFEEKQKKVSFNLSLRPGFKSSSLKTKNNNFSTINSRDVDFNNELGFRFGIEAEFILPYNKNKWSLIIEPTYQYLKSEKEYPNRNIKNIKVDYKSIELPIGIRHYLFLNNNSKLFINGSVILDFSSNSTISFDLASERDLEIEAKPSLAFGIGYKHNNKYALELRYQAKRGILNDYPAWASNYNSLLIIFGYSLF